MKKSIGFILGMGLGLFLLSCESEQADQDWLLSDGVIDTEVLALKTEAAADEVEAGVMAHGHKKGLGNMDWRRLMQMDCVTVSTSGDDFPKEITLVFDGECENPRGESRSGTIVITMSDSLIHAGAVYTVEYIDVYFGSKQVELSKRMENKGQNADGHWVIERSLSQTITDESGYISTRSHQGSREWISGFGNEVKEDNIFLETGTGSVVTPDGKEFTREIIYPLLHDGSCAYLKSGVVEMTGPDRSVIIDYGDGECDQWATVTINGEEKEVDLSERGKGFGMGGNGKGFGKGKGKGDGNGDGSRGRFGGKRG